MIVSLNWLKEYTNIELAPEKIADVLTDLGLEVEGLEEVQTVPGGLKGFVTAHVLTCERFEVKEKKLSLCTVDFGGENPAQVVCGAANVATGQKVILATVGTQLYNADASPMFQITAKKTYGHQSEGMICAEDEMNLGTSHDGILVLPAETPVGIPASTYFNIEKDYHIEIGLTPNRSDATCHLGVARDLAASLKVNHAHDGKIIMPDVSAFLVANHSLTIPVSVENHEACPRYAAVSIRGISVAESPDWLKKRLAAIGVRSINNIVDITNFVLHELGQPLHAFDADEIKGGKVLVKTLAAGTSFLSLDAQNRTLFAEDLMICDAESNGMCIGGVFGGERSGVKDSTTNIFLEAAHFSPKYIRRSSTRHGLRTDAAKIFEKGSDPNLCVYALKRAALLIQSLAGGEIASEIVDIYPTPIAPARIEVFYDHITRLIGEKIEQSEIKNILDALGIEILNPQGRSFIAVIPTNKADVLREVDVIEEILRVYGFNKVTIPLQIKSAIQPTQRPDPVQVKNLIANHLAANGFNEMAALSLSKSKYYKEIIPIADEKLVYLANSLNVDLDMMRAMMLFSGLEAVEHNQNRQQTDLRLFEFGKTYHKEGEQKYKEINHLTLFMTGRRQPENWIAKNNASTDYYSLKAMVENVLGRVGASTYQMTAFNDDTFTYALRYHRGAQTLVEFGKVKTTILKKMDIKQSVYYADFHWDNIFAAAKKNQLAVTNLSKYPSVRRDLALVLDQAVNFNEIQAIAKKTAKDTLKDINLFDVFADAQKIGEGKKSYSVSFVFEDAEKTLQEKDIETLMSNLIQQYEQKLGALIRK